MYCLKVPFTGVIENLLYQPTYSLCLYQTSRSCSLLYFNRNWHFIRSEWVNVLTDGVNPFGNRTNNIIESSNDKMRSVLNNYLNLPEFTENVMTAIKSLKTERDPKAEKTVNLFETESALYKYQTCLRYLH